jgi:MOSC domain-containing protein YiiM
MTGQLLSIQVALPQWHGTPGAEHPLDQPWQSSFFKQPVTGEIQLNWDSLAGDGQADRENHGGPDKAVLAYSADHYDDWKTRLKLASFPHGAFGENLTLAGITERDVCLGDVWKIGACKFEVSQPRQPCWKLARRWRIKDLPAQVVETGRTGWYLRIQSIGTLVAGQSVELLERPNPTWSVERANQIFYFQKADQAASRALFEVTHLAASWKETLLARL